MPSRMFLTVLPREAPSLGRFLGPKITSTTTRMMRSSGMPSPPSMETSNGLKAPYAPWVLVFLWSELAPGRVYMATPWSTNRAVSPEINLHSSCAPAPGAGGSVTGGRGRARGHRWRGVPRHHAYRVWARTAARAAPAATGRARAASGDGYANRSPDRRGRSGRVGRAGAERRGRNRSARPLGQKCPGGGTGCQALAASFSASRRSASAATSRG